MQEMPLRHAAALLIEYAIRIAPPESRKWGQAMRGELSFVDGQWAALGWAFGGARVMAKHALIAFFLPGRGRHLITPYVDLFERRVPNRKAVLATAVGFVLAAFVFLAAPPFRQALRVSLEGWKGMSGLAEFRAVAKQAEARRDTEGMAFVAVRLRDDEESARLAEEAVQLDPTLTWVYAVEAANHRWLPNIREWLPKLERWDAHNTVFQLIAAASVDRSFHPVMLMDPKTRMEWVAAGRIPLAREFASSKFDDYLDRLRDLDRRVVQRYGFNDPYLVIWWEDSLPDSAGDVLSYARSVLEWGETLEAHGDHVGAAENYWKVARFGQVIDSQGHTDFEEEMGSDLQARAYKQLERLSKEGGNANDAALFGYLAGKFTKSAEPLWNGEGERAFGDYVIQRNAFVLQLSSFMMVVFSGLIVVSALFLIIGRSRRGREDPPRQQPVATMVALTSGAGVLLSAATIYLTYRPYWYIFQRAMMNGDRSHAQDLSAFLFWVGEWSRNAAFQCRRVWSFFITDSPSLHAFISLEVICIGIICVLIIFLRQFRGRPSAGKLQNHTQAP
jgi:hypothetical protein